MLTRLDKSALVLLLFTLGLLGFVLFGTSRSLQYFTSSRALAPTSLSLAGFVLAPSWTTP